MHRCCGIVLLFLLSSGLVFAGQQNLPSFHPSPTGATLRSLVIPGWGQAYNRQPLKSVIVSGLECGLVYGIYRQHKMFQFFRDSDDMVLAEQYRNDRNRMTWYLTGTLILSMIDAYVDAHLYDFDVSSNLSSTQFPGFNIAGIRVYFGWIN